MANVFNIQAMAAQIQEARDKAFGLPVPPYPVSAQVRIEDARSSFFENELSVTATNTDNAKISLFGTPMCFPVTMKRQSQLNSEYFTLPVEPIITLQSRNELIRRSVSKQSGNINRRRGQINEYWAQDDFTIQIDGLLTRVDDWNYPKDDLKKLVGLLESREALDVQCPLLEYLQISRIVIDEYSLPFTKGEENQAYSIKAYSDEEWELFIKLKS